MSPGILIPKNSKQLRGMKIVWNMPLKWQFMMVSKKVADLRESDQSHYYSVLSS